MEGPNCIGSTLLNNLEIYLKMKLNALIVYLKLWQLLLLILLTYLEY